jgi:hypothetical protein
MGEAEQVSLWLELFRRSFDLERYAQARTEAEAAVDRAAGLTVETWLAASGVTVIASPSPSTFGTATVRGYMDVDPPRITVFESALDTLERVFSRCEDPPSRAVMRAAVLAHEAFHALHPKCPDTVTEMAAHLFATRMSGLGFYAGLLDVAQALSRHWR